MTERERDLPFEALAKATGADWNASRGELNVALKSIREQAELDGLELVAEIHERAALYPDLIGGLLTPTSLMKHWTRIGVESERVSKPRATNQSVEPTECQTCHGDRFVVALLRTPQTTTWMSEHGLKASEKDKLEELAPCPDCNPIIVTWRKFDGHRGQSPDPAAVREMLRR
jgi:hypothetical protein